MTIFVIILHLIGLICNGQIGRFPFYTAPAVVITGGNMLSNGVFDDATDWTVDGTYCTISTGALRYSNANYGGGQQAQADMLTGIEINTAYTLTFDFTISSGTGNFRLRSSLGTANYNADSYDQSAGTGVHIHFTTPSNISEGGLRIAMQPFGSGAWSMDNLVLTKD